MISHEDDPLGGLQRIDHRGKHVLCNHRCFIDDDRSSRFDLWSAGELIALRLGVKPIRQQELRDGQRLKPLDVLLHLNSRLAGRREEKKSVASHFREVAEHL